MTKKMELALPERAAIALGSAKHELKLRELATQSTMLVEVLNDDARDQVHRSAMTLVTTRTTILKSGKEARADATAFSKAVIAEEARLIGIIKPEEDRLMKLRDDWDEARAAEKQALIDAEVKRTETIAGYISILERSPLMLVNQPSAIIEQVIESFKDEPLTEDTYQEFLDDAREAHAVSLGSMENMLASAKAHEAEVEKEKAERAADAARLVAEREAIDKERAELAEIRRKQQVEDGVREAKMRAQQEALDRQTAELDRIKQEVADAAAAKDEEERIAALPKIEPEPMVEPEPTAEPIVEQSRSLPYDPVTFITLDRINAKLFPLEITDDGMDSLGFGQSGIFDGGPAYRVIDLPVIANTLVYHIQQSFGVSRHG